VAAFLLVLPLITWFGAPSFAESSLVGDTIDDPIWFDSLPFSTSGNSCGFADDYDEECPFQGIAADVVYAFAPDSNLVVSIDLCASLYDTKVFVYEDVWTPGEPYACNDDRCGATTYMSEIPVLPLAGGHTYYIVVDGYGADCGIYDLAITERDDCDVVCPPGATIEGEPICHDDYEDHFNSGCGHDPPVFSMLEIGRDPHHICGTSGTYDGWVTDVWLRETDWYQIELDEPREITLRGFGEYEIEIALIDGREGCGGFELLEIDSAGYCEEAVISRQLDPGIYWLWTGPAVFQGVRCGVQYLLTLEGYGAGSTGIAGEAGGAETPSEAAVPARLLGCRPNPFSGSTSIDFELGVPGPASLRIYDPAGRLVRVVDAEGWRSAGPHTVTWDGRDTHGRRVAAGVYYYRLVRGPFSATRSLVIIE
jgi:hypothetical protein